MLEGQPESVVQEIESMIHSYVEKVVKRFTFICTPTEKGFFSEIFVIVKRTKMAIPTLIEVAKVHLFYESIGYLHVFLYCSLIA